MNEFVKILLSLSVSGTLLLLTILVLKRWYQSKFSRRWQYYIWMIVVLRFLLPFTPDSTIVGNLFGKFHITNDNASDFSRIAAISADGNESRQAQEEQEINTTAAVGDPLSIYDGLILAWAVLALVFFVRKITFYQSFIQYIKACNTEVSDIETLNLLSDGVEKLNIRTRVELYRNGVIGSPVMIGFFHPSIVLPAGELKEKELSYIFMHELIHYKRKDMFYKWLIQIVTCIHWFNPFVCLLEKEVNKSCELSCDEKVISILGDEARREYGDTLISFLRPDDLCKSSLASVTLTEGAEELKERLGAIMNFRKKTRLITMSSLLAAILLSVGGVAVGAYAGQPVPHENRTDATGHMAVRGNTNRIMETMWIVHESADILYYEDGSPYIHDILTNNTDKRIIETEYCMLAYNEKGSPLRLRWNFLDSSVESCYENLVRTETSILSGQTEDYHGGWSLYDGEQVENLPKAENGEADQVAYSLLCLKQVVFEDGTVWNNPGYEDWLKAYAGRETDVNELQNYYPYKYDLDYGS